MMEVVKLTCSVRGMPLTTPSIKKAPLRYQSQPANNDNNHNLISTGHGVDDGGGEADLFCPWDASNNAFDGEIIIVIIII